MSAYQIQVLQRQFAELQERTSELERQLKEKTKEVSVLNTLVQNLEMTKVSKEQFDIDAIMDHICVNSAASMDAMKAALRMFLESKFEELKETLTQQ